MNIAYFLTPKQEIEFLFDDNTFRKGLERMRALGYEAVPVTTRDNIYVGSVSVSDFMWYIASGDYDEEGRLITQSVRNVLVRDVMRKDAYPPVSFTASVEELMDLIMRQNFVSVVDARGSFMGIVTRRNVMDYFKKQLPTAE